MGILLLHLSDLHFGPHSRFTGEDPAKLGKSFFRALDEGRRRFVGEQRVDLVVVTGGVAESGKPSELQQGEAFRSPAAPASQARNPRHPEKREPPLSWGLQYIVRGDLLLEDGTVLTLDDLADEVGLPHLPYLDDMPDELEVDWPE